MKKFELVTVSKGQIKTVDGFINAFRAMGRNMQAIAVSTYDFICNADAETRKAFTTRCMDELNLSASSISFLKTAGALYRLDDVFTLFPYTNVHYFNKAIIHYNEVNNPTIPIDLSLIEEHPEEVAEQVRKMLCEVASIANSYFDNDNAKVIEFLTGCNQKDLKKIIDAYCNKVVTEDDIEVVEETPEEVTEELTEDLTPSEEEIEEVNGHYITYLDDDINTIIKIIEHCQENNKVTKQFLLDVMNDIKIKLEQEQR